MPHQRAINQAKPILSSLAIFSAVMVVLSCPSEYFLYSARWVETHRPRAVLALYLVGTWQLPCLALYWTSSSCHEYNTNRCRYVSYYCSTKFCSQTILSEFTHKLFIPTRLSFALCPAKAYHLKPFQPRVVERGVLPFHAILLLHTLLSNMTGNCRTIRETVLAS